MKLCPDRVFGGSSPVVTCLRHSMIVCNISFVVGKQLTQATWLNLLQKQARREAMRQDAAVCRPQDATSYREHDSCSQRQAPWDPSAAPWHEED